MGIVLGLLTNRWVQLALAVVATAIFVGSWQRYEGYSKEHKARLEEVAKLNDVITKGAIKAFKLSEATGSALYEAEKLLKEKNERLAKQQIEIQKRIKENEEFKRIIIPDSAVRLLNESASNSSNGGKQASIQIPAGARVDEASSRPETNLTQVLSIVAENNSNHLACVEQVGQLQKFVCDLYAADGQPLEYPVCH